MQEMELDRIKKKTLILTQTDPENDMVFSAWRTDGINADIIFKPMPKIVRLIRRFWVDTFFPGYSIWYGEWKKNIEKYDTVIVHADVRTRTVPKFIHKIKPSMRVIYWYWNPVNRNSLPELAKDPDIECWSFDEEDCKKYGMKKNIQYYYDQNIDDDKSIEYDIYFVGRDKGRKVFIDSIKNDLEQLHISYKFDVFGDNDIGIPYNEVQNRIRKAKAILEINQEGQVGCTLRALEALFFRKKLITSNKYIITEDFYNSNNIFILGQDDLADLKSFLNFQYDNKSDIYRSEHTINAWFMNFFKGRM